MCIECNIFNANRPNLDMICNFGQMSSEMFAFANIRNLNFHVMSISTVTTRSSTRTHPNLFDSRIFFNTFLWIGNIRESEHCEH